MQKQMAVIVGMAACLILFPVVTEASYFAQETAPETMTAPAPAPLPLPMQAQEKPVESEAETLVGTSRIESGGYGGPGIKFARIAGNDAVFVGGRGGWIINHQLVIGGAGYGMASNVAAPQSARTPYALSNRLDERLRMGYGGFLMEYFILPKKVFHATVGILVGGGSVTVNKYYPDRIGDDDRHNDMMDGPNDPFFIAEPEIHGELNIARFLRADLGVSYRMITGVNGIGLENDDLRGPGASLLLRFGNF